MVEVIEVDFAGARVDGGEMGVTFLGSIGIGYGVLVETVFGPLTIERGSDSH